MLFIRSSVFNIYFWVWTLFVALVCSPLLLFPGYLLNKVGKLWAIGVVIGLKIICNIDYQVKGKEFIPTHGPAIIASKHQSALETALFHIILDQPVYVLKKELLWLPLYGAYLYRMGMIVINRGAGASALKELIKKSKETLDKKRIIVIFPEGTRTKPGEEVVYHPGIAAMYNHNKVPIIPVALNTGLAWGKNGFIKRPLCVTIEFLPPVEHGIGREEFMYKLHELIESKSRNIV